MVFFGVRLVLQFNLLALGNVCCPTRAVVLGLSFYPLEQAPNMVIYAMSKSGTATSGLIYVCGFLRPKPRTNARDKRHKSIAKRRAAWTTRRFLARLLFTKPDAKRRTGGYCGCQILQRQTTSLRVQRTIPIPQRLIEPSLPRPSL